MPDKESWASKVSNVLTGGDDGWGVSTTGLVIFLVILMVAVIMLIVNAVYFFQVYNGASDADMNLYWSRSGALTLAIFNVIFAVLLGIEFFIVLRILVTRSQINDPSCIKAIGGAIDPKTGLPNSALASILDGKDLAYASADQDKAGYVTGIDRPGKLDNKGRYISSEYLVDPTEYGTLTTGLNTAKATAQGELTTAEAALVPAATARGNIPGLTATLTAAQADLAAAETTAAGGGAAVPDATRAAVTNAQVALINAQRDAANFTTLARAEAAARAKLADLEAKIANLPDRNIILRTDKSRTPAVDYIYYPYTR